MLENLIDYYVWIMCAVMVPMIIVQMLCFEITFQYPGLEPDFKRRRTDRRARALGAMFKLFILAFMVVYREGIQIFCAEDPMKAFVIHAAIIGTCLVMLYYEAAHFLRLNEQSKSLDRRVLHDNAIRRWTDWIWVD